MADPTLTMQDIADLAKVRRPVVTMWRGRTRVKGRDIPFPQPVSGVGEQLRFRRAEVVAYLEATGRGNNVEHRLDADGIAVPDGIGLEDLVTLLCLRLITGEVDDDCVEAAQETDPSDELLAREVAARPPTPTTIAFIDALIGASYGGADALARLDSSRVARELGNRPLNREAVALLAAAIRAASGALDPEGPTLITTGETPELVLALGASGIDTCVEGDTPAARALRRRLSIQGQEPTAVFGPQVRLLSVIGAPVTEALERIDDVLVELELGEIAVVVGSAAILCDAIPRSGARAHNPEGKRAATLRIGGLAAALRLPRGLWSEAYRQALGVWIFCGGRQIERPIVADLGTELLADIDHDALAADIAASIDGMTAARAYRYGRICALKEILAGSAVVPRGVAAVRVRAPESSGELDRVYAATLRTSIPLAGFDVSAGPGQGNHPVRTRSLAQLTAQKAMRVFNGRKISVADAVPSGTVRLLSADGSTNHLALDPLDAQRLYPRATRTEPGDVVFSVNPPRAVVDERGGNLVVSPSRLLRLRDAAGIGPYAVAAVINKLSAHQVEWESWNLPALDAEQSVRLEEALRAVTVYEQELDDRMNAVAALRQSLIEGISTGSVGLLTD
ncbi:hypothetical protein [Nocardia camponoti]|uniref:Uncharacterized protein n=1 Tax=Nocardia camponoti TaxID=1616106 RepID=A0A917VA34_9NOCA|nr:hypothetical protein [Nocardia camponoti]GGK53427.1 hypothetical protein GCM10011591_26570 [Nocardia camponoti]